MINCFSHTMQVRELENKLKERTREFELHSGKLQQKVDLQLRKLLNYCCGFH